MAENNGGDLVKGFTTPGAFVPSPYLQPDKNQNLPKVTYSNPTYKRPADLNAALVSVPKKSVGGEIKKEIEIPAEEVIVGNEEQIKKIEEQEEEIKRRVAELAEEEERLGRREAEIKGLEESVEKKIVDVREAEIANIILSDQINQLKGSNFLKAAEIPTFTETRLRFDKSKGTWETVFENGDRVEVPNKDGDLTQEDFDNIENVLSKYLNFIKAEDESFDPRTGKMIKLTPRSERFRGFAGLNGMVENKRDLLIALRSGDFNKAKVLAQKIEENINRVESGKDGSAEFLERVKKNHEEARKKSSEKRDADRIIALEISNDSIRQKFKFSGDGKFLIEGTPIKKGKQPPKKEDWEEFLGYLDKLKHYGDKDPKNFFSYYSEASEFGKEIREAKMNLLREINAAKFNNFRSLLNNLRDAISKAETKLKEKRDAQKIQSEIEKEFNNTYGSPNPSNIERFSAGVVVTDNSIHSPFIKNPNGERKNSPPNLKINYRNNYSDNSVKKIDLNTGAWVEMDEEEYKLYEQANRVLNDFKAFKDSTPWRSETMKKRLTSIKNEVLKCINKYDFQTASEIAKDYFELRAIENKIDDKKDLTEEEMVRLEEILGESYVAPVSQTTQPSITNLAVTPTVVSTTTSTVSAPTTPEVLKPLEFSLKIETPKKGKDKKLIVRVRGREVVNQDFDTEEEYKWKEIEKEIEPVKKKNFDFFNSKGKESEQKDKRNKFPEIIRKKDEVIMALSEGDLVLASSLVSSWNQMLDEAIEKWNKDTKKIEGEKEQKKEIEDKIKSFEKKRSEVVSIVNGSLRGKVDAVTQDELKALEGEFKNLEAVARGNIERGEKFESRTLTSIDEITEKYSAVIKKLNEEENKVYKNSWADILRARGVGAIRGGRPNTRVKVDYDKKITEEEDDTVDKSKVGRTPREIANESYQELLEKTSSFNNERDIRASGAYNELLSRHQGMYSKDKGKYEDLFAKKKFAASDFVEAQVVKDILGEKYTGEVNQAPTLPKVQSSFGKYDQTYKVPKPSFFNDGTPSYKATENKLGKDTEKVWDNESMKKDVEYKREILKQKAVENTVRNLTSKQPSSKKIIASKWGLGGLGATLVAGGLGLPAYMLTKDSTEPRVPITADAEAKSPEVKPPVVERLEMSVEDIEFGDSWNEKEKVALKDIFSSAGSINQYIDKRIMTNDNGIYYKSQNISGNPFTYQILERNAWDILNGIDKYSWVDRYGNNTKESVQNCLDEILSLMKKLDPDFSLADNKNMSMSDLIKRATEKVDAELYKYEKRQPNAIK